MTASGGADGESEIAALSLCETVLASIAKKANRHKHRARASVIFLTASTAAIPVFLGLSGVNFILGKVVPSVLAGLSAVVAALVELERPHERWNLYRRYQRVLEGERYKFNFLVEPYEANSRATQLAATVAQLQLDLHDEWSGLLPAAQDVALLRSNKGRLK
jgi:Protein of unknown function (DUF4231)